MTTLFDNFIKELLQEEDLYSKSFIDLPKHPPYGFWIWPDNQHFTIVGYEAHSKSAKQIISEYRKYHEYYSSIAVENDNDYPSGRYPEGQYSKNIALYKTLFHFGFTRVVDNNRRTYVGETEVSDPVKRTKIAKIIKDLADFYRYDSLLLAND